MTSQVEEYNPQVESTQLTLKLNVHSVKFKVTNIKYTLSQVNPQVHAVTCVTNTSQNMIPECALLNTEPLQ